MSEGTLGTLLGKSASREVVISAELVSGFADLVEDHNPLHLDAKAAAESRFGVPIAHGMLAGSLFSGLIAHQLPGRGSVYLSQTLKFRHPVVVGQTVVASVRCTSVDQGKSRVVLRTEVAGLDGAILIEGEAQILVDVA